MNKNNVVTALTSAGALAGLYFAFKNKKSFLGYAGYFLLGGVAGTLTGNIVSAVIPNPKKVDDSKNEKVEEKSTFIDESQARLQLGASACSNPSDLRCRQSCFNLGGRFDSSDRKCYKREDATASSVSSRVSVNPIQNVVNSTSATASLSAMPMGRVIDSNEGYSNIPRKSLRKFKI